MNKALKFCVFILSYGRADKVITIKTLRDRGYTGEINIICSDDDKTIDQYKANYTDKVYVFSKNDYKGKFDIGDNFNDDRVVVFARNAVWDIAKGIGVDYFLVLDDDYTGFHYISNNKKEYQWRGCKGLDFVFDTYIRYLIETKAESIAMIQGGDLIGGRENPQFSGGLMKRKAMNTFFCSTANPFKFAGRINEDTNTYTYLGTLGNLFLQIPDIAVSQKDTQQNSGGLTEFYLDTGTYYKSFYSILFAPSCVKVRAMGNTDMRLHHNISWNNCCPKIIRDTNKK